MRLLPDVGLGPAAVSWNRRMRWSRAEDRLNGFKMFSVLGLLEVSGGSFRALRCFKGLRVELFKIFKS